MKPCLVCGAVNALDAAACGDCGCADFGPAVEPAKDAAPTPSEPAASAAVEPARTAPVSNQPAKRGR